MTKHIYRARFPILALSTAVNGWQYATAAFSKEKKGYRRWQQVRSFFCAMSSPGFAHQWFSSLNADELMQISQHRPQLYFKPFRAYMSVNWKKERRLKTILDSYRLMNTTGGPFRDLLLQNKEFMLATFTMKDQTEGRIRMHYDVRFRKEGEFVLTFECDKLGGPIYTAAFSFEEMLENIWVCRIGCIQGFKAHHAEAINTAQNLMYGLRPKCLMVFALQELTRQLQLQAVYGVSGAIHVHNRKHAIHIKKLHSLPFEYNASWEEMGGKPSGDGWYSLPLVPVRKSMEEIKSHKRAQYRRRYEMLDNISTSISQIIGKTEKPVQPETFQEIEYLPA